VQERISAKQASESQIDDVPTHTQPDHLVLLLSEPGLV
jgi:hypothetical protein